MRLVVDANVFFAALLRQGLTRQLWLLSGVELWAPQHLLVEFSKHRELLVKKSGLLDADASRLADLLLKRLHFADDAALEPFDRAAELLTQDAADWDYAACALAVGADLWSNDTGFQNQKRLRVWKTGELARELGLLKT